MEKDEHLFRQGKTMENMEQEEHQKNVAQGEEAVQARNQESCKECFQAFRLHKGREEEGVKE